MGDLRWTGIPSYSRTCWASPILGNPGTGSHVYRVSQPPVHVARVFTGCECVHPNIFIPKVGVQLRKPVHVNRSSASFSCCLLPTLLPLLALCLNILSFLPFCRFHSCPEDSIGLWRVEKGVRPKELQESGCCSFCLSSSWSLHPSPAHERGGATGSQANSTCLSPEHLTPTGPPIPSASPSLAAH